MKNYKTCFVSITFVLATIFSSLAYAGTVTTTKTIALNCCEVGEKPKAMRIAGQPDTTLSVTSKGVHVPGVGVVTLFRENVNYIKWLKLLALKVQKELMTKEEFKKRQLAARTWVHITAQCTSNGSETDMFPNYLAGTTLTCNKGDRLILAQYRPDCSEGKKRGILELTIAKDVPDVVEESTLFEKNQLETKNIDIGQIEMPKVVLGSGLEGSNHFGSM